MYMYMYMYIYIYIYNAIELMYHHFTNLFIFTSIFFFFFFFFTATILRIRNLEPDVPRRLAHSNVEHLVSLSSEHRTHRQTDSCKHCMDRSLNCDHVFVGSDRDHIGNVPPTFLLKK